MLKIEDKDENERQQENLISHSQGNFTKDNILPMIQNNGEVLGI